MKRQFLGIWLPARLWLDHDTSMTQKAILAEVQSFAANGLPCFVSNEHLANLCGVSISAVEKAVKGLEARGLLQRYTTTEDKMRRRVMHLTSQGADLFSPEQIAGTDRNELRDHTGTNCGTNPQQTEGPTPNELSNTKPIEQTNRTNQKKEARPLNEVQVEQYLESLGDDQARKTAAAFYSYYEANGWKVGRNPMRNWRAAARNWLNRQTQYNETRKQTGRGYTAVRGHDLAEAIRAQRREP